MPIESKNPVSIVFRDSPLKSAPEKLRIIAELFDAVDKQRTKEGKFVLDEVQKDLRDWADEIDSIFKKSETSFLN